jgi:hypothetical protein
MFHPHLRGPAAACRRGDDRRGKKLENIVFYSFTKKFLLGLGAKQEALLFVNKK